MLLFNHSTRYFHIKFGIFLDFCHVIDLLFMKENEKMHAAPTNVYVIMTTGLQMLLYILFRFENCTRFLSYIIIFCLNHVSQVTYHDIRYVTDDWWNKWSLIYIIYLNIYLIIYYGSKKHFLQWNLWPSLTLPLSLSHKIQLNRWPPTVSVS